MSLQAGHVPTNHGACMVANAAVATPKRPNSIIPATVDEREGGTGLEGKGIGQEWPKWAWAVGIRGKLNRKVYKQAQREAGSVNDSPTSSSPFKGQMQLVTDLFEQLQDEIPSMTEREFYERIHDLKNENAKLLVQLDRKYNLQKIGSTPRAEIVDEGYPDSGDDVDPIPSSEFINKNIPEITVSPPSSGTDVDVELSVDDKEVLRSILKTRQSSQSTDAEKDGNSAETSRAFSRNDDDQICRSWRQFDTRQYVNGSSPIDGASSSDAAFASGVEATEVDAWRNFDPQQFVAQKSQFERWRNSYPASTRPSSAPATSEQQQQPPPKQQRPKRPNSRSERRWNPKITIPEPFGITIREDEAKAAREAAKHKLRKELERKRLIEEEECRNQFRARPAPTHIYTPLLQEIEEQKETKRRTRLIETMALELSRSRPFEFTRREEEAEERRFEEMTKEQRDLIGEGIQRRPKDEDGRIVRANPLPANIYYPSRDPKAVAKEAEEWRQIQKSMRAQRLLRHSKSPIPDWHSRVDCKPILSAPPPPPRTPLAQDPPDFDRLYDSFRKSTSKLAKMRPTTTPVPFHLKTAEIQPNKPRVEEELKHEMVCGKERRWPYVSSRSPVTSLGQLPPGFPTTMEGAARGHSHSPPHDETEGRWRGNVDEVLAEKIKSIAAANDPKITKKREREEKKTDLKRESKESLRTYRHQLDEMETRLSSERPLLAEKVAIDGAKQKANQKWKQKINQVGITTKFVAQKSFESSPDDIASLADHGANHKDGYSRFEDVEGVDKNDSVNGASEASDRHEPERRREGSGYNSRRGSGDDSRRGSGDNSRMGSGDNSRRGSGDNGRAGSGDSSRIETGRSGSKAGVSPIVAGREDNSVHSVGLSKDGDDDQYSSDVVSETSV